MARSKKTLSMAAALVLLSSTAALADGGKYESGYLTGDWGGARQSLYDHGVDTTILYRGTAWRVFSGGTQRGGNYNDELDVKFAIDSQKLFGLPNNKMFFHVLNNFGGKPNLKRVGSAQGIDNTETPVRSLRLYQAWTEQSFFDSKFSVLAGVQDLSAEFATTDMTANFIKPSLQTGAEMALSGRNGPSIFPYTSAVVRFKYMPMNTTYVQAAAYDGVPGDPASPRGTDIKVRSGDGSLMITEAGYLPTKDSTMDKVAVGGWRYSKKQADLVTPAQLKTNQGVYVIGSYQFYKQEGRNLGGFVRAGWADGYSHQVGSSYIVGLVGNGWIPGRADGQFGVNYNLARNSDTYMRANPTNNRNESGFDLYYRDIIFNGVTIQPEYQYIVNPGTVSTVKNASVFGLRFEINF